MPNRRQAIIWTNTNPIQWCIYAALREIPNVHFIGKDAGLMWSIMGLDTLTTLSLPGTELVANQYVLSPDSKIHWANMGPTWVGPRWAPCWPHEPCYQGLYVEAAISVFSSKVSYLIIKIKRALLVPRSGRCFKEVIGVVDMSEFTWVNSVWPILKDIFKCSSLSFGDKWWLNDYLVGFVFANLKHFV